VTRIHASLDAALDVVLTRVPKKPDFGGLVQGIRDRLDAALRRVSNQDLDQPPKVGLGLSGGARKLPALIGVLKALEYKFLIDENGPISYEIIGKSAGAIIGSMYMVVSQQFVYDRGNFGDFRSPAHKLEHILREHQDVFRFYKPMEVALERGSGFVNPKPFRELVKRTLEDRTFHDIPHLYIVVHNLSTDKDIIFGEERKVYPVWKAAMASAAMPGVIEYVIDGNLEDDPDVLVDGGTLRRSPLRELYGHDNLDLRICVYLGYHMDQQPIYRENENYSERLEPLRKIIKRLQRRFRHDLAVREKAGANRGRFDFAEDIERLTGVSIGEVLEGHEDGLIVIAPHDEHVRLDRNGLPLELIDVGYRDADAALSAYFQNHPQQLSVLQGLGDIRKTV